MLIPPHHIKPASAPALNLRMVFLSNPFFSMGNTGQLNLDGLVVTINFVTLKKAPIFIKIVRQQ